MDKIKLPTWAIIPCLLLFPLLLLVLPIVCLIGAFLLLTLGILDLFDIQIDKFDWYYDNF